MIYKQGWVPVVTTKEGIPILVDELVVRKSQEEAEKRLDYFRSLEGRFVNNQTFSVKKITITLE